MQFQTPLIHGRLIRRYKRFLADIVLDSGETVTAHCTNSGSMLSCIEEGAEVYCTPVSDPARKTRFTWEMIRINGAWVGVNTGVPNQLAQEFALAGTVPELGKYSKATREVTFQDSRFDLFAERKGEKCFVEVKNVTLKIGDFARFPDAVSTRGAKHLRTLVMARAAGYRAVMLYVIQRTDVDIFAPAMHIDPVYAREMALAQSAGVEIIPVQVTVSPTEISYLRTLPFVME